MKWEKYTSRIRKWLPKTQIALLSRVLWRSVLLALYSKKVNFCFKGQKDKTGSVVNVDFYLMDKQQYTKMILQPAVRRYSTTAKFSETCDFTKFELYRISFPVNFVKFFTTVSLQSTSWVTVSSPLNVTFTNVIYFSYLYLHYTF